MEISAHEIDLDHISLAEWLVELGKVAAMQGYKTGNGFATQTGPLEWYVKYEAGLSPEAALYAAAMEGIEYCHLYAE